MYWLATTLANQVTATELWPQVRVAVTLVGVQGTGVGAHISPPSRGGGGGGGVRGTLRTSPPVSEPPGTGVTSAPFDPFWGSLAPPPAFFSVDTEGGEA